MVRIQYQLLKDNEPIALGSMVHCLDVFYWEIYYGYDHLAYNIVPFRQDEEVYRKAKAFDEVKEYALSKNKDFEDRKDTARSNKEFDYFNTLQIANRAIINKCKQLEDE